MEDAYIRVKNTFVEVRESEPDAPLARTVSDPGPRKPADRVEPEPTLPKVEEEAESPAEPEEAGGLFRTQTVYRKPEAAAEEESGGLFRTQSIFTKPPEAAVPEARLADGGDYAVRSKNTFLEVKLQNQDLARTRSEPAPAPGEEAMNPPLPTVEERRPSSGRRFGRVPVVTEAQRDEEVASDELERMDSYVSVTDRLFEDALNFSAWNPMLTADTTPAVGMGYPGWAPMAPPIPAPLPVDRLGAPAMPSAGQFSATELQFHSSAQKSGDLSQDGAYFVKTKFTGRLSVIAVDQVKRGGVHHFACRWVDGKVSPADGVGFIFGQSLPPTQNIQKVESVFVNKQGVVCSRTRHGVNRAPIQLAPLEVGARVDVWVDLDRKCAEFRVEHNGRSSNVVCDFGKVVPGTTVSGFFGAVVKNGGTGILLEA